MCRHTINQLFLSLDVEVKNTLFNKVHIQLVSRMLCGRARYLYLFVNSLLPPGKHFWYWLGEWPWIWLIIFDQFHQLTFLMIFTFTIREVNKNMSRKCHDSKRYIPGKTRLGFLFDVAFFVAKYKYLRRIALSNNTLELVLLTLYRPM